MRRTTIPFFALCYCAISGCGLLFDTEELRSVGGAGDGTGGAATATSTGGAPIGGGPTGAGVPGGAGPAGGGGVGGGKSCEDGEAYCGPSGQCDVDGLCTLVSAATTSANLVNVLFVEGGASDGYAVAQTSNFTSTATLSSWPLGFSQGAPPMAVFALEDQGVGFIVAGGPSKVYYAGHLQNCDADLSQDSCVSVCSINARGLDCLAPTALTDGSHINGAVLVPGASPVEDRLYFVESNDTSSERLLRTSRDCLEVPGPPCAAAIAANYDAPDALDPLGMDSDPSDGSLWWNTWGGSGLAGACVYQYPAASDLAQCVQTAPEIPYPSRLAVSSNSVFVGTFGTVGEAGPIQRLGRCMVGGQYPVTGLGSVTWPADADAAFLYATSIASPNELRVLNANTGALVKTLVGSENAITSVDATHPDFLLFAAGNRIYRWRKPPAPCPSPAGEAVCGDGCVDAGEDCDDGNDNGEDGCNAMCGCELPL